MLAPADWAGLTMRAYNSPVQEVTEKALGAVPVAASYNFPVLVRSGHMQAVETDVAQYHVNGYGWLLPQVARNVVLWPRMVVLALSSAAWARLSSPQQEWVRKAADSAVRASVEFAYDETTPAVALCALGVRFVDATPADLAGLRAGVRPVLDRLNQDPVTGRLLAEVEQVAARHPAPDVPMPGGLSTFSVPPAAATRSRSPTSPDPRRVGPPPGPSSLTASTSRSPTRLSETVTTEPMACLAAFDRLSEQT